MTGVAPRGSRRSAVALGVLALCVVAVPFVVRTHGIARDFWLMGDQIRDWDLVQSSFADLPVTGTPRSGGGHHVGPAYYHFLWLSRITLGPLLGNLPHVGGITVTLVDVMATFALAVALWRIGVPFLVVLALGVLSVSNPYPAALARAAWNPLLALAFSNLGLALYLARRESWSLAHQLLLAALCWTAIEMHVAAFPLTLVLVVLGVARAPGDGARGRLCALAGSALVVGVLELPLLLAGLPADAGAESSLSRSLARVMADPVVALSARGLRFVFAGGAELLLANTGLSPLGGTMLLCAAVALGARALLLRRDVELALAAYAPLLIATAAFTIFDRELNTYWLIPLLGAYLLVLALPFTLLRERSRQVGVGAACMIVVMAILPTRWAQFRHQHRYAWYATVVRAASEIARQGIEVRALVGPADGIRPTRSSPLVRWQGGILAPEASLEARVSGNGKVTLTPVAPRP